MLCRRQTHGGAGCRSPARRRHARHGFRQGLLSNLGNPKMAVFFTGLLPQFAPEAGPAFATMLALAAGVAALVARGGQVAHLSFQGTTELGGGRPIEAS